MKLLVVSPYFYPKIGGLENYAYNISKGLREKYGWEIVIVTSNHEKNIYKEENIDGIKVYRLAPWFKLSNTPINPLWYFQIKKIINKEKPNIINAHTPVPFISDITARASKEIPFILTYQNDLIKENYFTNFLCKLFYILLGNKTLKISDKIITSSGYYAKNSPYLSKYLDKICIVPPGVEISRFNLKVNRHSMQKKYGKHPYILFVGQLDKTHIHKGLNYLIDAINIVKKLVGDIQLLVVGKGDYLEYYKNYAKKLSLNKNISFVGFVSDKELPQYYAGSNITVLPTSNNSEGFGMILLEAGACGRPVIGTNVGGIPAVIDDQNTGIIVPPKDSKALAGAIIKILRNNKLAKEMGNKGYIKVKDNFTWDKQTLLTNNIFMESCKI